MSGQFSELEFSEKPNGDAPYWIELDLFAPNQLVSDTEGLGGAESAVIFRDSEAALDNYTIAKVTRDVQGRYGVRFQTFQNGSIVYQRFNRLGGTIASDFIKLRLQVDGSTVTFFLNDRPLNFSEELPVNSLPDTVGIYQRTERNGSPIQDAPQVCLLYTSPSPRDATLSRMPSSA